MLVFGDVVATISLLLSFALAGWASILIASLLCGKATQQAAHRLEKSLLSSLLWGVLGGAPLVILGIVLLNAPNPLAKIAGFAVIMAMVLLSFVGSAGLSTWVGRKINEADGSTVAYHGVMKASALIMTACIMPVFGWFFLAPVLLTISVGSALQATLRPRPLGVPSEAS